MDVARNARGLHVQGGLMLVLTPEVQSLRLSMPTTRGCDIRYPVEQSEHGHVFPAQTA